MFKSVINIYLHMFKGPTKLQKAKMPRKFGKRSPTIFQSLKIYAGEEFLVLENIMENIREKFMIPCKYIYP